MKIGVAQNQKVRITFSICAVSRRNTCRLATIQPTPTAKSPTVSIYKGSKTRKMLIWLIHSPAAVTISATASRWLIRVERKTDTGTISAGNTVLVIRLAWSSRGGGRALDGLAKQQPGQHPGEDVQRVFLLARRRRHAQADLENEYPTEQQYQRVNEAPDPSHGGTNEALFEIPAHQLEQQAAPFHQILQKKRSR